MLKKSDSRTRGVSKLMLRRDDTATVDSPSDVAIERLCLCVAMWDSQTKWLHKLTYRDATIVVDVNVVGDNSLLTDVKTVKPELL